MEHKKYLEVVEILDDLMDGHISIKKAMEELDILYLLNKNSESCENNKTIVKAELITGRKWVKRAMKSTKCILSIKDKEEFEKAMKYRLSDKQFLKLLIAKHSPIEEMVFWIEFYAPEISHVHSARHKEIGKYIATSRKDIEGHTELIDGMRYGSFRVNAKRLIEISEQRLCMKPSSETRHLWEQICDKCIEIEPMLQYVLYKPCVKLGFCQEGCMDSCIGGAMMREQHKMYVDDFTNVISK